MTWTYAGAPGTSSAAERRDYVRFKLGDTVSGVTPTLTDEEIAAMLSEASNDIGIAALMSGRAILARYARYVDLTEGKTSVKASQRYQALQTVVTQLESDALTGSTAGPYAGGTSKADKQAQRDDTDWVAPFFARDDDTYPGLGLPNRDDLVP